MQDPELSPHRFAKRLGLGMSIAAWTSVLALLAWLFTGVLERQYNPNTQLSAAVSDSGIKEVVLQRNRYGHYVASGTINGVPVVFLLDTGATDVALSQGLADRLGLERGVEILSQTANGRVQAWSSRLDSVSLGDIRMYDVRATILPDAGFDTEEVLLGMSFLKRLELVQRGDALTLRQLGDER